MLNKLNLFKVLIMIVFAVDANSDFAQHLKKTEQEVKKIGAIKHILPIRNFLFVETESEDWIASVSGRFVLHSIGSSLKVTDTVRKKQISFSEIDESRKIIPLDSMRITSGSFVDYPLFKAPEPKATFVVTEELMTVNKIKSFVSRNKNNMNVLLLDSTLASCGAYSKSATVIDLLGFHNNKSCNKKKYHQSVQNLKKAIVLSEMQVPTLIMHDGWESISDYKKFIKVGL